MATLFKKGSVRPVPLGDWGKYQNGPNPRVSAGAAPETFYNPLFALILTTLRFKEMTWGAPQGRDSLKATEFIESELGKKGFRTADLLSGFVTSEGESAE